MNYGEAMSVVYAINLKELEQKENYEKLRRFVSQIRREKAEKFYFLEDAKRSIGAELLIRYYLISNCNYSNDEIAFCFNEYGKPYIKGTKDLFFNVSHSNDWIVCGWNEKEIGIDVEKIKAVELNVAKSQFCKEEYHYIMEIKEKSVERFMQIWTLKESFVKYVGKGLSIPLDSFLIKVNKGKYILDATDVCDKVRLKLTSKLKGYYLAECSEDAKDIEIKELVVDDLLEVFCIGED